MQGEFEVREEIELDATPEQVWQAIATGPGVDSWFMGRNEIEPREGGTLTMHMPGWSAASTVTGWEPGKRLAHRSDPDESGRFMAFEYLIEGRDQGSTVLRFVHSGVLGDDWEAEYDALSKGDLIYLRKLAVYLKHFPGQTSRFNLFMPGPQVADPERVAEAFGRTLGLTRPAIEGDRVRVAVDGLAPVDGTVEITSPPSFLGVRTAGGIYLFIHGHEGSVVFEHHSFSDQADEKETTAAWQSWLDRSFSGT